MNQQSSSNKLHKTMRLPDWLIKKVEEQAKKENRSFNNMIETMLSKAVQ